MPAVAIVPDCARFSICDAQYTQLQPFQLSVDFLYGDSIAISGMENCIALAKGAVYQITYSVCARLEDGVHVIAIKAVANGIPIKASNASAQSFSDLSYVTAANSFLLETKEDIEILLTSATTSDLPVPVCGSISITRVRILEECPECI